MRSLPFLVVGGTFDRIHAGHKRLFDEAFRRSRRVGIGLVTDKLVATFPEKGRGVAPFAERNRHLQRFLRRRFPSRRWSLVPLEDRRGVILDPATPALAVSDETLPVALNANRWRLRHRLPPLILVVVGRLYGEDLLPIASRRIRCGEIDAEGNRLVPLKVEFIPPISKGVPEQLLQALAWLMPHLKIESGGAGTAPDYRVRFSTVGKCLDLTVTDSLGGTRRVVLFRKSPSIPVGAIAPRLLWEAFLPEWLSREGFLSPSVVLRREISFGPVPKSIFLSKALSLPIGFGTWRLISR